MMKNWSFKEGDSAGGYWGKLLQDGIQVATVYDPDLVRLLVVLLDQHELLLEWHDSRDYLEDRLFRREERLRRLIKMTEFKVPSEHMPESLEDLIAMPKGEIKDKMIQSVEAGLLLDTIEKEKELIQRAKDALEEWDRTHG